MSWGKGGKNRALQTEKIAKVQNRDEHSIACSYSNNVFYIISYIFLKISKTKTEQTKTASSRSNSMSTATVEDVRDHDLGQVT